MEGHGHGGVDQDPFQGVDVSERKSFSLMKYRLGSFQRLIGSHTLEISLNDFLLFSQCVQEKLVAWLVRTKRSSSSPGKILCPFKDSGPSEQANLTSKIVALGQVVRQ